MRPMSFGRNGFPPFVPPSFLLFSRTNLVALVGVQDSKKDLAQIVDRLLLRHEALVVGIEYVHAQSHHLQQSMPRFDLVPLVQPREDSDQLGGDRGGGDLREGGRKGRREG